MPILTPTAATGARSASQEMTYVDPARTMPPEEPDAFLEGTSLNGPFVADLLSDMMAHERAGARLYRSVAERTNNPVLKQRYTQFGKETTDHVEILESTFLLTGSVDLMTQELVMLDAVLLAEAKDQANWACLAAMVEDLPEGDVREAFQTAVDEVEVQEDEHLTWAQDTRCRMISLQSTSGPATSLTMKAEEIVARIRSLFE